MGGEPGSRGAAWKAALVLAPLAALGVWLADSGGVTAPEVTRNPGMEEVRAAAPDYPADFVLGILAIRYGLAEDARAYLQRALDAGYRPELVHRWLTRLSRNGTP